MSRTKPPTVARVLDLPRAGAASSPAPISSSGSDRASMAPATMGSISEGDTIEEEDVRRLEASVATKLIGAPVRLSRTDPGALPMGPSGGAGASDGGAAADDDAIAGGKGAAGGAEGEGEAVVGSVWVTVDLPAGGGGGGGVTSAPSLGKLGAGAVVGAACTALREALASGEL